MGDPVLVGEEIRAVRLAGGLSKSKLLSGREAVADRAGNLRPASGKFVADAMDLLVAATDPSGSDTPQLRPAIHCRLPVAIPRKRASPVKRASSSASAAAEP